MTRVIVNEEPHQPDAGAKTWGDLLAGVDDASHSAGRVVTGVRLDGVDEPSFRDAALLGRPLTNLAVVEVETAAPEELLADTVREALSGVDSLSAFAFDVSRRYRGSDLQAAHQGLLELVQGLQVLTSLLGTMAAVLRTDLRTLVADGQPVAPLVETLGTHLETLIASEEAQDWLTLADVIEYDIQPSLVACRSLFIRLGECCGGQASLCQSDGARPAVSPTHGVHAR